MNRINRKKFLGTERHEAKTNARFERLSTHIIKKLKEYSTN